MSWTRRAHGISPRRRTSRCSTLSLLWARSLISDWAKALYEAILDTWHAYDDAIPTLAALKQLGVQVAFLSNAALPLHEVLDREGLASYADAVVLSCEIGAVKPQLASFNAALQQLGTSAADSLMVGDSGHDDVGGTALGMRTLVLPRTRGRVHGLAVVVGLVQASAGLST